jgi:hypothetical protein
MSMTAVVQEKGPGSVRVTVTDTGSDRPAVNAIVSLYHCPPQQTCDGFNADQNRWTPVGTPAHHAPTDAKGVAHFPIVAQDRYIVVFDYYPEPKPYCIEVTSGCSVAVSIMLGLNLQIEITQPCATPGHRDPACFMAGEPLQAKVTMNNARELVENHRILFVPDPGLIPIDGDPQAFSMTPKAGFNQAGVNVVLVPVVRSGAAGGAAGGPALARAAGGASAAAAAGLGGNDAFLRLVAAVNTNARPTTPISGNITVSMSRTETEPTEDIALWTLIRNSTEALSFTNYLHFIDGLFCHKDVTPPVAAFEKQRFLAKQAAFGVLKNTRFLPFIDADAYRVLKAATEAFVMVNCGVLGGDLAFDADNDSGYLDRRDIPSGIDLKALFASYLETEDDVDMLPYLAVLRRKLPDIAIIKPGSMRDEELCFGIIQKKLSNPCMIELIWSYWQEEGMLVQSMNAITRRFQNVRGGPGDPLSNLEIDPLRPLNNLIWGYTQDEQHRLTVVRRNYEYDHHYGVRLAGRAIREFRPADSRSRFLEAFHFLLRLCSAFFRQDDDTTVKADAFPVLNALKEVHLILSQGAHNQFGDLPSTARVEMMMQQWLLARPEFREFLPTRIMVAYPEPWMDRVDAMKKLQEWSDTSVMHFRNLAIFGEQLLLSVRYGNWSDIYEPTPAFNWARFWRPQIQGYIHAYRAATGVDLAAEARDPAGEGTLPSVLLRQRLQQQVRSV